MIALPIFQQNEPVEKGIIFFDAACLLCNKTVLFLLKRDKKKKLQFAPIGGDTFSSLILETNPDYKDSVILLKGGKISIRSTAILNTLYQLPFPWKLAIVFSAVPRIIRDSVYRYVAKNRTRFFGENNLCLADHARYSDSLLK